MSAIIQGYQIRTLMFGVQVVKAAQVLPQTATATLATVSGGAVLVTSMLGLVTTAIGATATTLALGTAPTTGTAATGGIAAATAITSKEAGTWVTPIVNAGLGGALVVCANGGTVPYLTTPFVVSAGTITWTTSASDTGQMKWYFTYVPLDTGAALS
jgi:hypothetical protein